LTIKFYPELGKIYAVLKSFSAASVKHSAKKSRKYFLLHLIIMLN